MDTASSSSSSRPGVNFSDLDDQGTFEYAEKYATAEDCKNFVVEFGPNHARIAYNLDDSGIEKLLGTDRDDKYPIRWINIWTASHDRNRALTIRIGEHYGLSRRLTSLMTGPRQKSVSPQQKVRDRGVAATRKPNDVEEGLSSPEKDIRLRTLSLNRSPANTPSSVPAAATGNDNLDFFMMMKNTMNYSDIDLNPKALCIGAHWLHNRPNLPDQTPADVRPDQNSIIPPRHYRWLAVCYDNTVISVHDKPNCEAPDDQKTWRADEIMNMRLNTSTVLTQISKLGFEKFESQPLSQAAIRQSLQAMSHSDPSADLAAEGTSNLFYYLFEDYVAAVPLRKSGKKLEEITPKILHSATRKSKTKASEIIPALHYLSKDLRELKHLFEGYRYLITKVILASGKNRESLESSQRYSSGNLSRMNTTVYKTDRTEYQQAMDFKNRKVFLTESAMNRFDRLGDRLRWLMINTIDGYLVEIDALSTTYFNLTQQKDSSATARLTRSATLLAKLSVFFLPISFITSYFSIQIEDLYKWWNGNTYWYTFAVVATISFLSLFFFSRLLMFFSDVLDEWAEAISDWLRTIAGKVFRWKSAEDDDDA